MGARPFDMKAPEVAAFMSDYRACTCPHPFGLPFRLLQLEGWPADVFVMIEVTAKESTVYLDAIQVPDEMQRQGWASKALDWFVALARLHHTRVLGHVEAFGMSPRRLKQRDLRAWYKRHGFHVHRNGLLTLSHPRRTDDNPAATGQSSTRPTAPP